MLQLLRVLSADAGCLLVLEQPAAVNEVLARFLDQPPPAAARAVHWSPKNLRTRTDLRARTRKNGSENTIWEMLPYRS